MKALGIIAEYNPFHEGHKYLIDTASAFTKADVCISVMSGNFVQRGGYAYFDKWHRAEKALAGGIDLVVEMPTAFASGSASYFAAAGVNILNAMGCSHIAFGSESGNLEDLTKLADIMAQGSMNSSDEISGLIRNHMKGGMSYPVARETAIKEAYPEVDASVLSGSNDILAIEYLIALSKIEMNSEKMSPLAIKRIGDGHEMTASKIRAELDFDEVHGPRLKAMYKRYYDFVRYAIVSKSEEELECFDTAKEGLGNKLKKEIRFAESLTYLIERTKSKRYTYTRISRLLSHIVLGIKPEDYDLDSASKHIYIRPLAMNEKGASYLRQIKDNVKIPNDVEELAFVDDISGALRYSDNEALKNLLQIDIRASDIYSMLQGKSLYNESDYVKKPVIL